MTTKCSQGHNKVCANIIQLKKIKIDNIFFWSMVFNLKKVSFFIIFDKIGYKYHFYNSFNQFDGSNVFSGHIR